MSEIKAHITGTVWKITTSVGARIASGDVVVILESMKMEMPVESEHDGEIAEVLVTEGQQVSEGQPVVKLRR